MNIKGIMVIGLALVFAASAISGAVTLGVISTQIEQGRVLTKQQETHERLQIIKRLTEEQWKAEFAEETGLVHNDDISEYFYSNRRFRQQVSQMMAEGKDDTLTAITQSKLSDIGKLNAAATTFFNVFCSEFKCLAVMLNRTVTKRTDNGAGVEIKSTQLSVPEVCEILEHRGCEVNSYTVAGADDVNILVDEYLFVSLENQ